MSEYEHHDDSDDLHVHLSDDGIDPTAASVDHLAGTVAANGKMIWTPEQAATYLFRAGAGFGVGGNNTMPTSGDVSVISFGFHTGQQSLRDNGYVYRSSPTATTLSALSEYFNFKAFTPAQMDATREAMQYWDDVMAPSIVETHINDADIALGNYTNQPGTQAYARLTANTVSSNPYINPQIKDIGGDVWVNANTASNYHLDEGGYGMNTLVHEIGHGFGMLHPGNYNASPGVSLSYKVHAEYYQDTRSYSILSYWNPRDIGARDFDFTMMNIAYGATPMIHDILAVQLKYGADMTTRTGDTTYGFNSNAGRDAFDFVKTPAPMMTIWDAGGVDTLDASGYGTRQVIDLTPGSLSSIGGITRDQFPTFAQVNANRAAGGMAPISQATYDNNRAVFMTDPEFYGRLTDNVGIAYGVIVENAVGGSGADMMIGNSVGNALTGNAGDDFMLGRGGADTLLGGLGADTLDGGADDDLLDGGLGVDTMVGGAGNDRYVVDNSGDVVTEAAGEGTDTVASSISYVLGLNLENLELLDGAANGTGNGLANKITGNGAANALNGNAGDDQLFGMGGADQLNGGEGADTLDGGEGDDGLSGGLGDDSLVGGAGADRLDGGLGADAMSGGAGDDRYLVDSNGDVVTEGVGGGIDTVVSSVSYSLGANVENLEFADGPTDGTFNATANGLLSGGTMVGTGNELGNRLTGNGAANTLKGLAGDDQLFGMGGDDRLEGGAGADRLSGGDGHDVFLGGSGDDIFVGDLGLTKVTTKQGSMSLDIFLDFDLDGDDRFDMSGLDANSTLAGVQGFAFVGHAAGNRAGDLSFKTFGNINAAEEFMGIDLDGLDGPGAGTPVTIVFGDLDGDKNPDFAMVLIGTKDVDASDFIF